jgi:hypothetical protein
MIEYEWEVNVQCKWGELVVDESSCSFSSIHNAIEVHQDTASEREQETTTTRYEIGIEYNK